MNENRPSLDLWALIALAAAFAALVLSVASLVLDNVDGWHRPGMMSRVDNRDLDDFSAEADRCGMGSLGMGGMARMMLASSEEEWLVDMIAHHREGVAAAHELERSERQELRAFGRDVVEVQSAQIETMQAWADKWYDGARASTYRPMMRDLSGLSGQDLDRAFLTDMIRHHMIAVMMSQHLLVSGLAEHPEVEQLALSIRDDQAAEIAQMRDWL